MSLEVGAPYRGDIIQVGNITDSLVAIGRGAYAISVTVQQALSLVEERDREIRSAELRLATEIQHKLARYTSLATTPTFIQSSNPYKALLDFSIEDAPFFYGRNVAIWELRNRLDRHRFTVLHSDSGSGKTSLLQAGLASRLLAEGHFPLYLRPYRKAPGLAIRRAFLPDLETQEELTRFRPDKMSLRGFLESVSSVLAGQRLYILLDQFEEFFEELTRQEQIVFAAELQDCLDGNLGLPIWWVMSVRKEYFSDLRLFEALRPFDNEYFLPAFQLDEARSVITEPAAQRNVTYETELLERIISDLRGNEGLIAPPELQLVCYSLFDEATGSQITCSLYDKTRGRTSKPGAEGILNDHLNRVLTKELAENQRRVANRVLEALITSDRRRAIVTWRAITDELRNEADASIRTVLDALTDSRLLRVTENDEGQVAYELAHDYLLAEIALDPETQARKAAAELLVRETQAYEQFKTLLSRDRFEIINSQRDYLTFDQQAQDLLDASKAQLQAATRRRIRIAVIVAVFLILLSIIAVWFAFRSQGFAAAASNNLATATIALGVADQARGTAESAAARALRAEGVAADNLATAEAAFAISEAERDRADQNATMAENQAAKANSRRLSALASSLEDNQVMLAALLSVEAGHAADTAEAFESLNRFAPLLLPQLVSLDHGGQVIGAAWSHDESLALTWGTDGNTKLWDAVTGELYAVLPHSDWVNGADWGINDGQILTWSKDGSANVWEANSGRHLLSLHHEASVDGANWNKEEARILTWSDDGTSAVWDAKSGNLITKVSHGDLIYGALWSNDEQHLLTWSEDGTAAIWDAITGERLLTLPHGGPVFGAAWSTDESQVLTRSADGTAIIWDASTGEQLLSLSVGDTVYGAKWNADGTKVLTYGRYSPTSVWNASTGNLEYSAPSSAGTISGAKWSEDETRLLLWSGNRMYGYEHGEARIARIGQQSSIIELQFSDAIYGASFSDDESRLLIWSADGTASIWEVVGEARLFVLTHNGEVGGAEWNAAENRILTWSLDGTGGIWDATISEDLLPIDVPGLVYGASWSSNGGRLLSWSSDSIVVTSSETNKPLITIPTSSSGVGDSIAWSVDESLVAQLGNDEPTIVWDLESGKQVIALDTRDQRVERARWNDAGTLLLAESQSRITAEWSVDLWNITTGERLVHVDDTQPPPSAEWGPNDQQFLSIAGNEVIIWDIASNTPVKRLTHTMEVQGAIWKDDNQVLSWTQAGTTILWDLETGTPMLSLQTGRKPGSPLNGAAFNVDQSQFMTWGSTGEVDIWSISGNRLVSMMTNAPVYKAVWNADESRVFTVGNGVLTVWDAASGERVFGVTQDGGIMRAAWNRLGTQILTWGGTIQGGAATVWNGLSGERIQSLDANGRGVLSAAWNSDETQIVIVAAGGDIWRYYTQMDDLIEATCQRATRNLNWDEWRQYLPGESYRCSCPNLPLHPSVLASTDAVISDGAVCAEE